MVHAVAPHAPFSDMSPNTRPWILIILDYNGECMHPPCHSQRITSGDEVRIRSMNSPGVKEGEYLNWVPCRIECQETCLRPHSFFGRNWWHSPHNCNYHVLPCTLCKHSFQSRRTAATFQKMCLALLLFGHSLPLHFGYKKGRRGNYVYSYDRHGISYRLTIVRQKRQTR